ncbi:MAG: PAS domain-containing protein [Pseudomonadota bacterium]
MLYTHRIDADGRIVAVDAAWIAFAQRNWRPDFKPALVLGRPLEDFIDGLDTQAVHRLAAARVRVRGRGFTLPFRCDSPDLRRFMEMTITPLADGGLEYSCLLLREEVRAPVPFRPCGPCAVERKLKACSICLRLERPAWGLLRGQKPAPAGDAAGTWLEAEQVLPLVAALEEGYFPPLTYAVCPDCRRALGVEKA